MCLRYNIVTQLIENAFTILYFVKSERNLVETKGLAKKLVQGISKRMGLKRMI